MTRTSQQLKSHCDNKRNVNTKHQNMRPSNLEHVEKNIFPNNLTFRLHWAVLLGFDYETHKSQSFHLNTILRKHTPKYIWKKIKNSQNGKCNRRVQHINTNLYKKRMVRSCSRAHSIKVFHQFWIIYIYRGSSTYDGVPFRRRVVTRFSA